MRILAVWTLSIQFVSLMTGAQQLSGQAPSPSLEQTASDIWTTGPILEAVNVASLYADSKTFVDQPLLVEPAVALAAFDQLPKEANGSVSRSTLSTFMSQHFAQAGSDLDNYTAPDYQTQPPDFLPLVANQTIKKWGYDVNALWNYLSRQERSSVTEFPERTSLLILPYPTIVAGDRFREAYYWDSYFIVEGLLISGMNKTAMNVVRNLGFLAEQHGLIPNGARTYYINRSQPPLFSEMVRAVYEKTEDAEFLADVYTALLIEYAYYTQAPRQVTVESGGSSYNLTRYYSDLYSPRPESYREDTETAEGLSEKEKEQVWHNLAVGAATGWDFSTRWFMDGSTLQTINASMFIPADLNAFMYKLESNLAYFAEVLGEEYEEFQEAASARKEAMNVLMWQSDDTTGEGAWHDLLITELDENLVVSQFSQQTRVYASNYVPLWAGLAEAGSVQARNATNSLLTSGLIQAGGILTSLYNSSQQWDAPNAWPCLQFFVVEGLSNYGDSDGQQLGAQIAQTWLNSNYVGYLQNGNKMVEKYDGIKPGASGGGGEYAVQTGFGWTNGVMLFFLEKYGWVPDNGLAGSPLIRPFDSTLTAGPALAPA